jgi:hypothetical protein
VGLLVRTAAVSLAVGLVLALALGSYYHCLVGEVGFCRCGTAGDGTFPDVHVNSPGIETPPTQGAGEARIGDETEIIGICAGGRARAYVVLALGGGPARHVINDLVGGYAVSVTYCDRTKCSRAFGGGRADHPLQMSVAGWLRGGMALRVRGKDYSQETGESLNPEGGPRLPYAEWPHKRTTWGAWRETHPDTDVYVGGWPPG